MFESFTQVDASRSREYGGTGSGLSISKRLVEAMGGEIGVEGEIGEGSTFHFTIEAEAIEETDEPLAEEAQAALDGKRVLIVEKHETTRRLLGQLVEAAGMEAVGVASRDDALRRLDEREDWDVILLDEQITGADGRSLRRQIQEQSSVREQPIISIDSAPADEHDAAHDKALRKPVKQAPLYDALLAVLGESTRIDVVTQEGDEPWAGSKSFHILLAEDDPVNQKMTTHLLEKMGHEVRVVTTGEEALAALEEQAYDVVLMDAQMLEMGGLEATRRIRREWPSGEQPYIVALTASVMQDDREHCREGHGCVCEQARPTRGSSRSVGCGGLLRIFQGLRIRKNREARVLFRIEQFFATDGVPSSSALREGLEFGPIFV